MTIDLEILSFQPLELRVRRMGPFQEDTETVEFFDDAGAAATMFLLVSANGRGKTTLLEAVVYLCERVLDPTARAPWLVDAPKRELQLDIRVHYRLNGDEDVVVVSSVDMPSENPIARWSGERLTRVDATSQIVVGRQGGDELPAPGAAGADLIRAMQKIVAIARTQLPSAGASALDPVETLPTILFFGAQRDIGAVSDEARALSMPPSWRYQPAMRFGTEDSWASSLDRMLTWLRWLDEDGRRFRRAVDVVNRAFFDGTSKFIEDVDREHLTAMVNASGSLHRLDQLSSGERNVVQLLLRIGVHMTRNTIVVIDEVDLHLHPRWERSIVVALKRLVHGTMGTGALGDGATSPSATVIFTTHSKDCMNTFAVDRPEAGLVKAGHVVEDEFDAEELH